MNEMLIGVTNMAENLILNIGDLNEIESQIKFLTEAMTEGKISNVTTFFRNVIIHQKILERKIDEYRRFIPIIYQQVVLSTDELGDGIFDINIGPFLTLTQRLLMMVPKEGSVSSEGSGINKLRLLQGNEVIKTFEIYKESNRGQLIKASKGDIIPGRTVLFRLIDVQLDHAKAIILNTTGLFTETVSNLYVSQESMFGQKPIIYNPQGVEPHDTVVTSSELASLREELNAFKALFKFVEGDAKEVAEDPTTPDGAIIIEIDRND